MREIISYITKTTTLNIRRCINYADVIARDQQSSSVEAHEHRPTLRVRILMIRQAALILLYGARAQVTFTFSMNHNIDRSLSIGAVH